MAKRPRRQKPGLSNHGRSHSGAEKLPPNSALPTDYWQYWLSESWTSTNPTVYVEHNISRRPAIGDFTTVKLTGSNPSWKLQVQNGVNASTRYLRRGGVLVPPRLFYTGNYKSGSIRQYDRTSYSSFDVFPNVSVRTHAVARDQAVARVKNRISNLAQSAQVLTPLAEIHELRGLCETLLGLTTKVVSEIAALKRKGLSRTVGGSFLFNKRKRIQLIRDAQDIWLTYSFGVKPLLADIRAASKAITEFVNRRNHNDQVTGTGHAEWFQSASSRTAPGLMAWCDQVGQWQHSVSYKYVCGWRFAVLNSSDYSGFQHFGVTPGAWVSVAWETFPFSWIADYFSTIGDALDDTFVGTSGQSVYIVEDRRYTVEGSVSCAGVTISGLDAAVTYHTTPGKVALFEFERTPLAALPSRSFRFKTVDEINRNTVNRLLNLSALLKPSFKG